MLKQIDLWLSPAGWGGMVQGVWVDQVVSNFTDVSALGAAAPGRGWAGGTEQLLARDCAHLGLEKPRPPADLP
jgi:hypothetical protein